MHMGYTHMYITHNHNSLITFFQPTNCVVISCITCTTLDFLFFHVRSRVMTLNHNVSMFLFLFATIYLINHLNLCLTSLLKFNLIDAKPNGQKIN